MYQNNSYESSLFFDMLKNPVEDFLSENSNKSNHNDDAIDDDEVCIEKMTRN